MDVCPLTGQTRDPRAAAYARLSTEIDKQLHSYSAQVQVSLYQALIRSSPGQQLAGIYTDHGISEISTLKREDFNGMKAAARADAIDLILTKGISRFARNTVDSLTMVRALNNKSVEVCFEKENFWMLSSRGELLITIMSSLT